MHHRHMADLGIGGQYHLHPFGRWWQIIAHVQRFEVAAQILENAGHALTVGAVHQHQGLAVPRQQGRQSRFHRVSAATLQRHADVGFLGARHFQEPAANASGQGIEIAVPGAPIAQHGGLGGQ